MAESLPELDPSYVQREEVSPEAKAQVIQKFYLTFQSLPPSSNIRRGELCTCKCRGIELVRGLAEAAADHLRTAKAFLANPRVPPDTTNSTTGAIPSAVVASALHSVEKVVSGGGGVRTGRKAPSNKAAPQGLSAVDLESLIAELLSRKKLLLQEPEAGEISGDGVAVAARGGREASAEEVASWLVKEVGHRRQVDESARVAIYWCMKHGVSSSRA